jgi:hypothetical protein
LHCWVAWHCVGACTQVVARQRWLAGSQYWLLVHRAALSEQSSVSQSCVTLLQNSSGEQSAGLRAQLIGLLT